MKPKQKIQQQKQAIRESSECSTCIRTAFCKYKRSTIFYEETTNTELDCWLREDGIKKYISGFHAPMNVMKKNSSQTIWNHLLNEKYSITQEKKMYN